MITFRLIKIKKKYFYFVLIELYYFILSFMLFFCISPIKPVKKNVFSISNYVKTFQVTVL